MNAMNHGSWLDATWCILLGGSGAWQHLLLYLGDTMKSTLPVIALLVTLILLSIPLHLWAYKLQSVPFDLSDAALVGQLLCICCSLCRGVPVICIVFFFFIYWLRFRVEYAGTIATFGQVQAMNIDTALPGSHHADAQQPQVLRTAKLNIQISFIQFPSYDPPRGLQYVSASSFQEERGIAHTSKVGRVPPSLSGT